MTTTTTTIYPPLPELAPRGAQEAAEQYGLRALLFITAERLTCTVDQEGLELAAHVFRLACCNPALTETSAERVADVGRMISGALARRLALDQTPAETPQAPAGGAGADRPNLGPMAPLAPAPRPQAPPSAARRLTPQTCAQCGASYLTQCATCAAGLVAAPQAPPSAARRARPAPVATPSIRLAPVAPALAAEELF